MKLTGSPRTLATAVVTASLLVALEVALLPTRGSGDRASAQAPAEPAASSATPPPTPKPRAGARGPEGVPLVRARALGRASSPAPGRARGGIPCGSGEQLSYHVHARLSLFVHGRARAVPLGVGIGGPLQVTTTAGGPFAAAGRCFSFLHTHAADGIIHIEAPGAVKFRLGQFFDVWRQDLGRTRLGAVRGRVVAYVDGHRFRGDPRAISLRPHAQITLEVGRPLVPPRLIEFPAGL